MSLRRTCWLNRTGSGVYHCRRTRDGRPAPAAARNELVRCNGHHHPCQARGADDGARDDGPGRGDGPRHDGQGMIGQGGMCDGGMGQMGMMSERATLRAALKLSGAVREVYLGLVYVHRLRRDLQLHPAPRGTGLVRRRCSKSRKNNPFGVPRLGSS